MPEKTIHVVITYTGHDDYDHDYNGNPPVGTVKLDAMREKFGLEPSAKEEYELVMDGIPVEDGKHLRDFGLDRLLFVLRRKDPVTKGIR
jgi:hypothetical protein